MMRRYLRSVLSVGRLLCQCTLLLGEHHPNIATAERLGQARSDRPRGPRRVYGVS